MLHSWLLAVCAAHALTPPVGWTAQGADRAVMIPSDPGRGEVREVKVAGSGIDPQALIDALSQAGESATLMGQEADGTVSLKFSSTSIGRARVHTTSSQVSWYLVMVDKRHSANLDADALLTALIPRDLPAILQGEVEVLPAGADGTLWDPVATPAAQPASADNLWGAPAAAASGGWGHSEALVGIWGGTLGGPWGGGVEYVFTFDATGRLRVVETGPSGSQVTEGTWSSSGGKLRLESYTAEPEEIAYHFEGKSLGLVWKGQPLTLVPRR